MWKQILDNSSIERFMNEMDFFHDSCIKEMWYISGAYVNENRGMHAINSARSLRIIIQRQSKEYPVIELEFQKLKFLRLLPNDENYTCEILDSTLLMSDGYIYWMDWGGLAASDIESYTGTIICAETLSWRSIDRHLGAEFYYLGKNESTCTKTP